MDEQKVICISIRGYLCRLPCGAMAFLTRFQGKIFAKCRIEDQKTNTVGKR
tara:strand:- start:86 stop:238 length:153 start_codon:yes stop_codon:yes gene_type:complete